MKELMLSQSRQAIKPRVLYITSRGHSGSTLLSLLISGNSNVFGAGELKMLTKSDSNSRLCSCHRVVPDQCPFWSAVQIRVIELVGCPLHQLVLDEDGHANTFMNHNQALFSAIADVSGCSFIVDSSKSLARLSLLLDAQNKGAAFDICPIHLHRGPFGTINSARKRGDPVRMAAYNYIRLFFLTCQRLRGVKFLRVYYERLASNPRAEVESIMDWLNIPLEECQFNWRDGVRRDINGNDMRFSSSDCIRLDQSWRSQLTLAQKFGILFWTMPVRLRSFWIFRKVRFWVKPGVHPFP